MVLVMRTKNTGEGSMKHETLGQQVPKTQSFHAKEEILVLGTSKALIQMG